MLSKRLEIISPHKHTHHHFLWPHKTCSLQTYATKFGKTVAALLDNQGSKVVALAIGCLLSTAYIELAASSAFLEPVDKLSLLNAWLQISPQVHKKLKYRHVMQQFAV